MENYLDFIKEKKYRFALTRFRLSSHDLAIERGRYENIVRICVFCNSNFVESEYHLIPISLSFLQGATATVFDTFLGSLAHAS